MFTSTPEPVTAIEGEIVDITVKAHGKPTPDIIWIRNTKGISSDQHMKIETVRSDVICEVESRLHVTEVQLSDASDQYRVRATNKLGTVEHHTSITGQNS